MAPAANDLGTADRLSRLHRLTDQFEDGEWKSIECFFIGALSVKVDDAIWDECLRSARDCALSYGKKLKAAKEVTQ